MKNPEIIHATCVEVEGLGVLFRGPPGSGKSDLALRLIDRGCRLIADDYTELSPAGGKLVARPPAAIRGLLEVRGVGVLKIGAAVEVELGVVIDLVAADRVERLPDGQGVELLGLPVPLFRLAPFEASAVAKVKLVVRRVKGDIVHIP